MAYFDRTDVEAEIKPSDLQWLLDDDADGAEDPGLFDSLRGRASERADAILARRYTVPFGDGSVPAPVSEGALLAFCALLYRRRGTPDKENPFAEREKEALSRLRAAADGEADLDAAIDGRSPVGSISDIDLDFGLDEQEGL